MALDRRRVMDGVTGLFSSLRLAVFILIVLAAVSVVGTFIPQGQEPSYYIGRYGGTGYARLRFWGLIDLYHSYVFRTLTALLAANLSFCTLRRLKGIIRRTLRPDAERSADAIMGLRIHNELPSPEKAGVLERALSDKKYRITKSGRGIYGAKGAAGPWGDMVTHLSILVIFMGALAGSLGHVGTVNVYEGDWTDRYYNWNEGRDKGLGFQLFVERLKLEYYPVRLEVSVRERMSGWKVGVFKTREGGRFTIPGTDVAAVLDGLDYERREALLKVYRGRAFLGVYNTGLPEGGPLAPPTFGYAFDLDSIGGRQVKSMSSTVRIVRDGKLAARGVVEVNSPMEFEGLTIYQTAYGNDDEGRRFSGFQFVHDPGVPLVWAGFALLLAGLFFSFFFYHRQVWVHVGDDKITVGGTSNKDMGGFMREYGGMIKSFIQEVEP